MHCNVKTVDAFNVFTFHCMESWFDRLTFRICTVHTILKNITYKKLA